MSREHFMRKATAELIANTLPRDLCATMADLFDTGKAAQAIMQLLPFNERKPLFDYGLVEAERTTWFTRFISGQRNVTPNESLQAYSAMILLPDYFVVALACHEIKERHNSI